MKRDCVVIFMKDPRPGAVKTRLARHIGSELAAHLYRQLLAQTVRTSRATGFNTRVYTASRLHDMHLESLKAGAQLQQGRTLGVRIHAAFKREFKRGAQNVLLIGTDAIHLDKRDLQQAMAALRTSGCVLGPATDGGYYLIGLKTSGQAWHAGIFKNIPWSGPRVLSVTLKRLQQASQRVKCLRPLVDLDTKRNLDASAFRWLYSYL